MYKWDVKATYQENQDLLELILKNRGIDSTEEQEIFLNPPSITHWFKNLPEDFLQSLKSARELINKYVSEGKPVVVHGDYDADGICATAILYRTLRAELNHEKTFAFIPNRFEHGYGLSQKSIDACLALVGEEKALVITVDSGITSTEEVATLKEKGHDVIITDHHQKPDELPGADVIVWNDQVVGASIAFILSRVLGSKNSFGLALAGIATVTDLQPLTNFNRTIVKRGLEIINTNPPIGIKALLESAGKSDREISTYDFGWVIGPRLNASGRVEDASNSLGLLLSNDPAEAKKLAWQLNQINTDRQNKTLEMYELASQISETEIPSIIISHHDDYHEGIIGLVASKLVQKYYRPAIVISTSENLGKGSVRSIPGLNIIETLREFDDLFVSLGGHPMAAGFSIEKEKIEVLQQRLAEVGEQKVTEDLLERVLEIDVEIPAKIISLELLQGLSKLKPFGLGNSTPVFSTNNLTVTSANFVGREHQHLSLRLSDGNGFYKAIYFNYIDPNDEQSDENNIETGDTVDVAYNLKENHFNGKTYIDLILKDIRKSSQS